VNINKALHSAPKKTKEYSYLILLGSTAPPPLVFMLDKCTMVDFTAATAARLMDAAVLCAVT